jgi:hypothetical protein
VTNPLSPAEAWEHRAISEPHVHGPECNEVPDTPAGRAIQASTKAPFVHAHAAEIAPWLRLSLFDALAAHVDGRAQTCDHRPLGDEPVIAVAWRPGPVVCLGCTYLLDTPPGSTAEETCNACGRQVAGTPDDPICPGTVHTDPLIFHYRTCAACKAEILGGPR